MTKWIKELGYWNWVVIFLCLLGGIVGGCAIAKATKPVMELPAPPVPFTVTPAAVLAPPPPQHLYLHWDVKAMFGSNAYITTWPYRIGNQTLTFDVEIRTNLAGQWTRIGRTNWNVYPLPMGLPVAEFRCGEHFE